MKAIRGNWKGQSGLVTASNIITLSGEAVMLFAPDNEPGIQYLAIEAEMIYENQ